MRLLPTSLFAAALLCLAATVPARAEGGATVPPIDNAVVQKECGACHADADSGRFDPQAIALPEGTQP